jgi:hypothetical protein
MQYRIAAFAVLLMLGGLALGARFWSDASASGEQETEQNAITGVGAVSDGTDGAEARQPSIGGVTNASGSIRSVERIEGISTPVLQNLETALKMQEPPTEPQAGDGGGGGGSAAAAAELLAPEPVQPITPEETDDDRDIHLEFSEVEMEGS